MKPERAEAFWLLWREFGRLPVSQGADGRDHNRHGFSLWLAGGGFNRGYVHGSTDDFGYKSVENIVTVHDLQATLLHALGLDHRKLGEGTRLLASVAHFPEMTRELALHIDAGDAEALPLKRIRAGCAGAQRDFALGRPAPHQDGNVLGHYFSPMTQRHGSAAWLSRVPQPLIRRDTNRIDYWRKIESLSAN